MTVATAAQCLDQELTVEVRLGFHNLSDDTEPNTFTLNIDASHFLIHSPIVVLALLVGGG